MKLGQSESITNISLYCFIHFLTKIRGTMASMGDKYDLITPRNEQFSELHFTLTCEWAFK